VGPPSPPFQVGWHPDPTARYELRYFNGETWTADVSASGRRLVDPFGPPKRPRDGRATAAMVLGIVGVCTAWMPFVFVVGGVCAVLGIIFGAIVLRQRRDPRGFALTGVITGVAGLVLVILGVVTTRAITDAFNDFADEPRSTVVVDRCVAGDGAAVIEGTIENLGDRSSDYRIVVRVRSLPSLGERVVIEVDDVRPGTPVPFRATADLDLLASESDVTCEVVDVTGPPPLGLDL
jgi:Protein of unknown function (DUF2510)